MGLWSLFRGKQAVRTVLGSPKPFVIDIEGSVYSDPTGRRTDVELSGGAKEVLAAGRWVVTQGQVLVITNESPTYLPSLAQMQKAVAHLAEIGLDVQGKGKGPLVVVYTELDKDGQGIDGKRYLVVKSSTGVELVPEGQS
jgi:hypothetical protein